MGYILAHDYGTSSLKSVLFSTDGTLLRECNASYQTYYSNNNRAEQNPEDWWTAFCKNNKILLKDFDPKDVLCVSFCGTYPNLVCIDKDGAPLHNALIWQDNRAVEEADEISAKMNEDYVRDCRGGKMSPGRSLPKLLWIRKHHPDVYEKIYKIFPCASQYIIYKLCGSAVADYRTGFSSGLLNLTRDGWSDHLIEIAELSPSILPELHNRTDIVGTVLEEVASECGLAAGTKLVIGTGDGDSADVGMGMLNDGDAYFSANTSAAFLVVNKKIKGSWPPPTSCSGASITWMKNVLGGEDKIISKVTDREVYDLLNERIASAPLGCHGVMFLPYLSGERGAINNPLARGSFTGITLEATTADMLRAVYEGIGMNLYNVLNIAKEAGYTFTRMPMVGGMAKSPVLRQILADILGIELYTVEHVDEVGTMGTAVLGGIGIGLYEDETAYTKFLQVAESTMPNMENHAKYMKRIGLFNAIYEAQKPLYEQMQWEG